MSNYQNKNFPRPPSDYLQEPLRSRQTLSGPQIYWFTIDQVGAVGGNIYDIPVTFPAPVNTFFIGSIKSGDEANSLLMSLAPLGKPRGASFATFAGTEQVFYLTANSQILFPNGPHYYSVVRFSQLILNAFFHMGTENGGASRYTLGCLATDRHFRLRGGLYF